MARIRMTWPVETPGSNTSERRISATTLFTFANLCAAASSGVTSSIVSHRVVPTFGSHPELEMSVSGRAYWTKARTPQTVVRNSTLRRSEEHTSELQSQSNHVYRLL